MWLVHGLSVQLDEGNPLRKEREMRPDHERLLDVFRQLLAPYSESRISWRTIAQNLNEMGIRHRSGGPWDPKAAKTYFDNHKTQIINQKPDSKASNVIAITDSHRRTTYANIEPSLPCTPPGVEPSFAVVQITKLINTTWDDILYWQTRAKTETPNRDILKYLGALQSNLNASIRTYCKVSGVDPGQRGGQHDAALAQTNILVNNIITEPDRFADFLTTLNADLEKMAATPDPSEGRTCCEN